MGLKRWRATKPDPGIQHERFRIATFGLPRSVLCGTLGCHGITAGRGARTPTPGGMSMNSLRRYKHAILLAALIFAALIESFSHRQVLGPILSHLAIVTMMLLVFLIVFHRRVTRLVAFMA